MQYAGVLEPIDLIERHPHSGVWQPYLQHHNVIIVSKDNPSTKWVRYAGYLGIPLGTPKFTGATEVWHAPLGVVAKLYTDVIAKMAEVLKVTRSCDPTRGLGARHYIKHPYVSNWQHVQALSAPHLVGLPQRATTPKPVVYPGVCSVWCNSAVESTLLLS